MTASIESMHDRSVEYACCCTSALPCIEKDYTPLYKNPMHFWRSSDKSVVTEAYQRHHTVFQLSKE
ncbi:hypothetical protein E2C01_018393 [Portunus trituberculatus]|uniref:Uncharacterized protein n=1 Tax=Portunus trituberculatus TaxID=210409 RepID=A0A5B7DW06_PORTR|nr:hypothetical protein [Portunus trituberculatus]